MRSLLIWSPPYYLQRTVLQYVLIAAGAGACIGLICALLDPDLLPPPFYLAGYIMQDIYLICHLLLMPQ
jgi:hypothetical protein